MFSCILFQYLDPRDISQATKEGKKQPSLVARLMLVGGPQDVGQKGVATGRGELSLSSYTRRFRFSSVQLQRLGLRDISQVT
jgi:hypothetical protein